MRVQDTVPVIVVSMAKKKHKQQQQLHQENQDEQNNSESVDERDGSCNSSAPKHCVHINKSVSAGLQKCLKKICLGQCSLCTVSDGKSSFGNNVNVAEQPDIYLCLQCANQGCDRTSPGHHALSHYQTAHSTPHDIAVNLSTYAVWCYACDDFVANDVSRKLKDCIDLLRRQSTTGAVKNSHQQHPVSSSSAADAADKECSALSNSAAGKQQSVQASTKQTQIVCSKVKGLANLGNTCFFNAVLQNLCQTHLLDQQLREWTNKGQSMELVAISNSEADDESNCDDECDQPKKIEYLTVRLADCGPLTQSVLNLFDEVTSTVTIKQRNYVSPSGLFNQVCHKAPRFKGFQQQDSHELLRYLLDGMKAEEIKRAQVAILKAFNLSENQPAKDLPEDKKMKIKEFGRSAKHTFVDRIFGGVFISTVVCQVCRVPTQMFEPFLDLSLPIADEKSSSHMGQMGKSLADVAAAAVSSRLDADAAVDKVNEKLTTKNQLKRQQKLSRKQKKQATVKSSSSCNNVDGANGINCAAVGTTADDETMEGDAVAADEDVDLAFNESVKRSENYPVENGNAVEHERTNASVCDVNDENDSGGCIDNVNSKLGQSDNGQEMGCIENNVEYGEPVEEVSKMSLECNIVQVRNDSGEIFASKESSEMTKVDTTDAFEFSTVGNCDDERVIDEDVESQTVGDADCSGKELHTFSNGTGDQDKTLLSDVSSDKLSSAASDHLVDSNSAVNGEEHGSLPVDAADRSYECFADKSFDARYGMLNGFHSPSPGGDMCSDEMAERGKQSEKTERRHRAMLAAMETAGVRQKPLGKECSLNCSLLHFTAVETLSGNNMLACSFCNSIKQKTNETTGTDVGANGGSKSTPVLTCASKQLLIYSAPAILTLHLKRFQQVGYNLRKNTQHVDFTELLDLAPYCSAFCEKAKRSASGQAQILYSLYGVIEHSGTLRSGHYTAYVKVRHAIPDARQFLQGLCCSRVSVDDVVTRMQSLGVEDWVSSGSPTSSPLCPTEGRWYHISDTSVSEVRNIDSVLNCQAYILFYERVA